MMMIIFLLKTIIATTRRLLPDEVPIVNVNVLWGRWKYLHNVIIDEIILVSSTSLKLIENQNIWTWTRGIRVNKNY